MKLNEPRDNELKRQPKYLKSKGGLLIETKTYIDYIKASEYKESYKQFCIQYYLYHKNEHLNPEDKKLNRRNERI